LSEYQQPQSPDYGNKLGHQIFYFVLKWFGPAPAYVMLAFVVPWYVFLLRRPRASASYYLKKRFPGESGFRRLLRTYAYIYSLGLSLIDQAAVGILGRKRFKIDFPDQQKLYELSKSGKGMVLLTSHAGNWQTAMAVVDDMAVPVNFLLRLEEHVSDRFFFNLSGNGKSIKIIDPTSFLGGLVEATKAIQKGECVSIMGDRAWGARTKACRFLGQEAAFPITPYHLVASNDAELVIVLTARTGKLAFRIDYIHYSCRDADCLNKSKAEVIDILLKKYVESLENYIEKYPYQWFNFFDFWKIDKTELEAETL
jgi:predicted LPLAT superfamily acyltransferase